MITKKVFCLLKNLLCRLSHRPGTLTVLSLCLWSSSLSYGFDYQVKKLTNGLTLVTAYFSHAPLVTTQVLFNKAGSVTETRDDNGLTHVFEHLFFSANDLTPNRQAMRKKLRELGITHNASVSMHHLDYSFYQFPSAYLKQAIELMAAIARTLKIKEEDLLGEIPVILDELDLLMSQPSFVPQVTTSHILYGEDLYHTVLPMGSRRKILAQANTPMIEKIKHRLFAPENITILITGAVSYEKAYATVNEYFGSWENPPTWTPPTIPTLPTITKTQRWNFAHPANPFTYMHFSFPTFPGLQQSHIPQILSVLVLENESPFNKKYLQSGKWISGGYSYSSGSFRPNSTFSVALKENTVGETIPEVLEEIERWGEEGYFSEKTLKKIKKGMIKNFKIQYDQMDLFSAILLTHTIKAGPLYLKNYLSNISQVTLEDVRNYVKNHLVDQPYLLQVHYNSRDAEEWAVDLNGDAYYSKHLAAYYHKER